MNNSLDNIDQLRNEWLQQKPSFDTSAMDIVGRIISHSERYQKSISERLKPYALGYTDFDVLATVRRSGAPFALKPAEILNSVLIQSGSLTSCIDRLEKQGLIVRRPVENDRRSLSVNLTNKGIELIDEAAKTRFEEALEHVSKLNNDDKNTLITLLKKLNP